MLKTYLKTQPNKDARRYAKSIADAAKKLARQQQLVREMLDNHNTDFLNFINNFAKLSDAIKVQALYEPTLEKQGDAVLWADRLLEIQEKVMKHYAELFGPLF
jgi:hypothetical protein